VITLGTKPKDTGSVDGLDGGPSAQLGQDVVHHDRGAPNSSELPVNEFAELRQSHDHEPTQN
jgi:hypothetical protein